MKKKLVPEIDEFYVGYFPQAPGRTASLVQKVVIVIGVIIVVISALLVFNQKPFSKASFDYGKLSLKEGYLFKGPVPHLKVPVQNAGSKNFRYQTILLVGFGKTGADKTISEFEKKLGLLEGKLVALKGYLIKGNGRTVMQLEEKIPPVILGKLFNENTSSSLVPMGTVSLSGEIVDPKCYFGVMKPGEGKPHRSCAIRCIAGGIPPVFHTDSGGYMVLLGDDFQPVNQQVLSIVGDHINLGGQLVQFDDWKILLIKRDKLKSISNTAQLVRNMLAMQDGMTVCQNN
jgi:hypothetical protein